MKKYDELLIAIIGLNYVIKDLEDEINGAEMCRMSDISEKINILTKLKDNYKTELSQASLEKFGF